MKKSQLIQLIKEVLSEINENKVVDVNATLKNLQSSLRSGSTVTIEDKEVFKMPMINLATFVEGGRVQLPTNGKALEAVADVILVDGEPLELIYKNAPAPTPPSTSSKPFDTSAYTDPESIYYRGGD